MTQSINTITPTFNNRTCGSVVNEIKLASDARDNTDELTFERGRKVSSHGAAAKTVRERHDDLAIDNLEKLDVDGIDYFNELLKDGF